MTLPRSSSLCASSRQVSGTMHVHLAFQTGGWVWRESCRSINAVCVVRHDVLALTGLSVPHHHVCRAHGHALHATAYKHHNEISHGHITMVRSFLSEAIPVNTTPLRGSALLETGGNKGSNPLLSMSCKNCMVRPIHSGAGQKKNHSV